MAVGAPWLASSLPTCPLLGLHYYLPCCCRLPDHTVTPEWQKQSSSWAIGSSAPAWHHPHQHTANAWPGFQLRRFISQLPWETDESLKQVEGQCNHQKRYYLATFAVFTSFNPSYKWNFSDCITGTSQDETKKNCIFYFTEMRTADWFRRAQARPNSRSQGTQAHVRFLPGGLPCSPCLAQGSGAKPPCLLWGPKAGFSAEVGWAEFGRRTGRKQQPGPRAGHAGAVARHLGKLLAGVTHPTKGSRVADTAWALGLAVHTHKQTSLTACACKGAAHQLRPCSSLQKAYIYSRTLLPAPATFHSKLIATT